MLLFMIIISRKAYSLKQEDKFTLDEYFVKISDNKLYAKIFVVLVIIQFYFIWLIILKPSLIQPISETLLNISYVITLPEEIVVLVNSNAEEIINNNKVIIEIVNVEKIFKKEEKIIYLFQYFESIKEIINTSPSYVEKDCDLFRYYLRQLNFDEIIRSNTTLDEIRVFVDDIVQKYITNQL